MKARIITLIFISSLGILLAGKAISQEGIEEKLFNEAFPELQGNLLDSNKTSLSVEEIKELRTLLEKIDKAIDNDLNPYPNSSDECFLVFKNEKLKEAGKSLNTEKLRNLLVAKKNEIRLFMGSRIKYGCSKEECTRSLALLIQASKNWNVVYQNWNLLFHYYPLSSKTIYTRGTDILEYKFEKTKDPKWIDTLMMLYDQRIRFFGKSDKFPEGYILGRKAVDLLKYRREEVEQAYAIFEKSVKLQGVKSEDPVLLTYMLATEGMFVKNKIDAAKVVDNFTTINAFLEERIKDTTNVYALQALDGVTELFIRSNASTCEQLITLFQKRADENKNDIEQLQKISRMLSFKDCTDTELFSDVVAAINRLKPPMQLKYDTFVPALRKKDYDKAIKYLNEAVSLETVDSLKAKYYFRLAQVSNEMNQKAQAITYALKAVSLKSNYGAPYILIATMYASSGCSELTSPEGELENVASWAAVDKLIEAKSVDPSIADAAESLIRRYSEKFPNAEKVFLSGLTKGQTVKIGCWINETTTVR